MFSKVDKVINQALKDKATESCQINIWHNGKIVFEKKYGKKYQFFDLASLTKAVFTTPVIIQLVKKKEISLAAPVERYLPYFKNRHIGKVKIRSLLDQTSGLDWWKPFYKSILKKKNPDVKAELMRMLSKEKPKKNSKCVYSDLNFILLGFIIEEVTGKPLDKVFKNTTGKKLKNTGFNLKRSKKLFAPTEKNYRGVVRGQVHDDNAYSFGGVSGHAGLFSNLKETSQMAESLLKVNKKFTKRAVPKSKGDWALGFVIPSRPISTGGSKISDQSFGFTGFTGPSIWIDRKRNTIVTILANRTYPSRKNRKYVEVRRHIHDAVWESIDG